jgi:hypothetical protein
MIAYPVVNPKIPKERRMRKMSKRWYSCEFGCEHWINDKCDCECHKENSKGEKVKING